MSPVHVPFPFRPPPPTTPPAPSPAATPCHLFSLSRPLALASCRWETLAWSLVRGRGTGVVWWTLPLRWAKRSLGHFSLDWHRRAFPARPPSLLERASQQSFYFPTCCITKCLIAPAPAPILS